MNTHSEVNVSDKGTTDPIETASMALSKILQRNIGNQITIEVVNGIVMSFQHEFAILLENKQISTGKVEGN